MNNYKCISIAALLASSMNVNAAEFIGNLDYDSHFYRVVDASGNVEFELPSRNFTLPAYIGDNVIFYHDATQVNLNRNDIDILVSRLDVAVDLYRDYGDSQYPYLEPEKEDTTADRFLNTASVALFSHEPGPAGLGYNGKGDIYKSADVARFFDNWPTDARTWEVGYYEMGRGSEFSIYPFFHVPAQIAPMYKAFPRFITWATLTDVGVNHLQSSTDPVWGAANVNVSPVRFENNLNTILFSPVSRSSYNFVDFYNTTLAPEGKISDNGITVDVGDAYAVVLNDLRERHGHQFMVELFNFARKNASTMTPSSGEEALCNISTAANVALSKISEVGINQNAVGSYLTANYNFPVCSNQPLNIQLDDRVTHIVAGRENVISWDAWGNAPANSHIQVYIINKEGRPWQHFATFDMGVTEFRYNVPSFGVFGKQPHLEVFIGVVSGNTWISTHSKKYTPTNNPNVTITTRRGVLQNVGKAYFSWEANFELANEGFQLWGDFNFDSRGWVHLGGVSGKERSLYIDMHEGSTIMDAFLGAIDSGQIIASDELPFAIVD